HYLAKRLSAEVILDAVSEVTRVPTAFAGYAPGTRALQLPDTSIDSYFLDVFGRPQRAATCACERDSQPNLRQTLHVINGDTINQKLSAEGRWIDHAVKQHLDNSQVLKELYLSAYSRYPTDSEMAEANALLGAGDSSQSALERRQAIEDFTWAMLTDKEFVFNH